MEVEVEAVMEVVINIFYFKMEDLISLFNIYGQEEYFGEKINKRDHMIQTALEAEKAGEVEYIILACLLHDIGHFLEEDDMDGLGVSDHGKIAAEYLRNMNMDERVCKLVEKHVDAKRYLVSKNNNYYDKLTSASKKTLEYQGGKMNNLELENMERDPDFFSILKIRKYDDMGKKEDQILPKIECYIPLINKFII